MVTSLEIARIVEQVLQPGRFFVALGASLRVEHQFSEQIPWELFRGHLLDERQTRQEKSFESWTVWVNGAPILSIKLDGTERAIHVTRSIETYTWEAYGGEGKAILSREATRWVRELIGTLNLELIESTGALRKELAHYLFLAVVGTDRLPITSLESPLPGFSLGQLAYFFRSDSSVLSSPLIGFQELIEWGWVPDLSPLQQAKLLETVLRTVTQDEVSTAVEVLLRRWQDSALSVAEIPVLLKMVFNHVALSPYTQFVDNLVSFLLHLSQPSLLGVGLVIDVFSYYLRHTVRHLTAFDLVAFHNHGANYPDALMLEALLKAYLRLIDHYPDEFADQGKDDDRTRKVKRLRRRGLRQAYLLRKRYEGLPVPDAPTSPGENLRVLPEPFSRVPMEQIAQPHTRRRRLFTDEHWEETLNDTARHILAQALQDLETPVELCELGMATYLDRPLGVFKQPGEVDRTPLLSYEAFSRLIAEKRLQDLQQWGLMPSPSQYDHLTKLLREAAPRVGVPVTELSGTSRPGVVALEDARRAAEDSLFLHTTRSSLETFLAQYDLSLLKACAPVTHEFLCSGQPILLIRSPRKTGTENRLAFMTAFDADMQPRVELALAQETDTPIRYGEHYGTEYLQDGLRLLRVWVKEDGNWKTRDCIGEKAILAPKG